MSVRRQFQLEKSLRHQFMHIFNAVCDFDFSKQVALEIFSSKADYRAFLLTYNRRATCANTSDWIMGGGALSIARLVAEGKARLEPFLRTFDATCSVSAATTVAIESSSGKMDLIRK